MKMKSVILRSKSRSATRDHLAGSFAFPRVLESMEPTLSVEVEELESKNIPTLSRDSEVVAFAPVMPFKLIRPFQEQENARERAGSCTWGVQAVGADSSPYTGHGITVSVLDTGIDVSHAAFSDVQIIQKDFTGEGTQDRNGHGTHCAGTIFGRDVQDMRIGVAPGVKKALIGKVLGENGGGSTEQIIDGIMWAVDNGANIISMSLGMDFPGLVRHLTDRDYPVELATSIALDAYRANTLLFERLASLVRARGSISQSTIIIAAAGNESRRNQNPDWEIAVAPPAVSEGIVSVGAVGEDSQGLTVASFSNTGPNICAPGVRVLSAGLDGGLVSLSGTSMATPHVAGVAALWADKLNELGRLNGVELSARLIGNSSGKGLREGFDPFDIGAGVVQAPQE